MDKFVFASVINHLAWTMTEMGELKEALEVYRQAEKLMK